MERTSLKRFCAGLHAPLGRFQGVLRMMNEGKSLIDRHFRRSQKTIEDIYVSTLEGILDSHGHIQLGEHVCAQNVIFRLK